MLVHGRRDFLKSIASGWCSWVSQLSDWETLDAGPSIPRKLYLFWTLIWTETSQIRRTSLIHRNRLNPYTVLSNSFDWDIPLHSEMPTHFKLVFFVPPSALQVCKKAISSAGAGRYPGPGNYTECCWTASGTGQFRPGDTANPNIGSKGTLEEISETRVETLCVDEEIARKAVDALKRWGQSAL